MKKKLLANELKFCNNILSKGFGLMFRSRDSVKDTAWIFPFGHDHKICITMLFVFFEIDILFLDSNKRVVDWKTLKPFENYCSSSNARYVIELEKGIIHKFNIKKGDIIIIENNKLYK